MKTKLLTGLLLALAGLCASTVFSLLGFYADPAHLHTAQLIDTPLRLAIGITGLALGLRACRKAAPGPYPYGKAVGDGALISLWNALFSVLATILFFTVIDANAVETIVQAQVAAASARGADPDRVEKGVRFMTSVPMMCVVTAFMVMFMGVILTLIVAAFLRRPAAPLPPPTAPAV